MYAQLESEELHGIASHNSSHVYEDADKYIRSVLKKRVKYVYVHGSHILGIGAQVVLILEANYLEQKLYQKFSASCKK